jgi:hypothetical protein
MAYNKTTWIARVREFAKRVILTPTGETNEFDQTLNEGDIATAGTPFSPVNMNNIEDGIFDNDAKITINAENIAFNDLYGGV